MRNLVRYSGSAARAVPNANNRQVLAGGGGGAFVVPSGISPGSLAGGTVGIAFGPVAFTVAAGLPAVHWQISGGTPPPGLSINDAGSYGGTPSAPGVYTFSLRAFNRKGAATINLSHTIV